MSTSRQNIICHILLTSLTGWKIVLFGPLKSLFKKKNYCPCFSPFNGLFPPLSLWVSCPNWSKPRMSKEGLGPVEVGGPVRDVRASESHTHTHSRELSPDVRLTLYSLCRLKHLWLCISLKSRVKKNTNISRLKRVQQLVWPSSQTKEH